MVLTKFAQTKFKLFYIILFFSLINLLIIKKIFGFNHILNKVINSRKTKKIYHRQMSNEEILKKIYSFCYYFHIHACLTKSLLATKFFIKNTDSILFHVGVKNEDKKFSSHSWIDINGQSIVENKKYIESFKIILSIKV